MPNPTVMRMKRVKIGLLLTAQNTAAEPALYKMAPEGVTIHTALIPVPSSDVSAAAMPNHIKHATGEGIEKAARELLPAEVHTIIYGDLSGSFSRGLGKDLEIIDRIRSIYKVPATTPVTSGVEALKRLRVRKLSVATSYFQHENDNFKAFFEGSGFRVLSIKGLQNPVSHQNAEISQEGIYKLVKETFAPESDGIFIGCYNLPAAPVAAKIEAELKVPVVAAHSATMWKALRSVGYDEPIKGFGRILEEP